MLCAICVFFRVPTARLCTVVTFRSVYWALPATVTMPPQDPNNVLPDSCNYHVYLVISSFVCRLSTVVFRFFVVSLHLLAHIADVSTRYDQGWETLFESLAMSTIIAGIEEDD